MVELLASNQRMRVRFPLAAPRHIAFKLISAIDKNPGDFGYNIVPIYQCSRLSSQHIANIDWIEENLTDKWSWFQFGGYPIPGISYCFKSKQDAGIFLLCKSESGRMYKPRIAPFAKCPTEN